MYPDKLCRAMLKGIRDELVHSGIIGSQSDDMLMVNPEDSAWQEYLDEYVDDMTGEPLIRELVVEARGAEMEKFQQHKVYTKRPISECVRVTGKQPIGSKWIDINKRDSKNPNYRSRLVHKKSRETTMKTCLPRRHHWKRKSACSPWRSPASPGGVVR